METGESRWNIVVCYLATGDETTIRDVEAAMAEKPRRPYWIVARDLKKNLGKAGSTGRDEEITAAVATSSLVNLAVNLFLRQWAWCRDRRTWQRPPRWR